MSIIAKVLSYLGAASQMALLLLCWCTHVPSAQAQDSSELVSAALLDADNADGQNAAVEGAYSDTFGDAERALREGLGSPSATSKAAKTTLVSATENQRLKDAVSEDARNSFNTTAVESTTEVITDTTAIDAAAAVLLKPAGATKATKGPSRSGSDDSPSMISILQKKLSASELHVKELEHQLSEAKSRLMAAEVEISRLLNLEGSAGRAAFKGSAIEPARGSGHQGIERSGTSRTQMPPVEDARALAPKADLQVATVVVEQAELRLGPGKDNPPLMSLRRGSRLMVEDRQGEWYRVYAPNGERAWVDSSLIRFGDGAASLNDGSSVKIRGFDPSIEQEVFRSVQSMVAGN